MFLFAVTSRHHISLFCQIRSSFPCVGPLIALCVASSAIMGQNCHFHHICQIVWASSLLCALPGCRMWQIVIFAIFAKFATFTNLCGSPHCFVLCLVGECDKIVIFTIFATLANFYGPPHCFVLCLVGERGKVSFLPYSPNLPHSPTSVGPSLLCALPCW